MSNAIRIGSLLLALVAPSAFCAQPPTVTESLPINFNTLDRNGDGRVSLEEAKVSADLQLAFKSLDVNTDDQLTPTEFAQWPRASKTPGPIPDPTTAPSGSNGSQHMPDTR